MGKYRVTEDKKANSIIMELSGYFTDEDAINYVKNFVEISNRVKTEDTYLVLDCGLLYIYIYPIDMIPRLKDIFMLYRQMGYKKIIFKLYKAQKEMALKACILSEMFGMEYGINIVD